jgi:hypothetical protein
MDLEREATRGPESSPRMPRWVKVFLIIVIVVIVAFVASLVAGVRHGPGLHGPPDDDGSQRAPAGQGP